MQRIERRKNTEMLNMFRHMLQVKIILDSEINDLNENGSIKFTRIY